MSVVNHELVQFFLHTKQMDQVLDERSYLEQNSVLVIVYSFHLIRISNWFFQFGSCGITLGGTAKIDVHPTRLSD